jgi:hypothetical protein
MSLNYHISSELLVGQDFNPAAGVHAGLFVLG